MSGNRLYIYDPAVNAAVCIAQGYTTGWVTRCKTEDRGHLNRFFDSHPEYTQSIERTRYELRTEEDLSGDAKIFWENEREELWSDFIHPSKKSQ